MTNKIVFRQTDRKKNRHRRCSLEREYTYNSICAYNAFNFVDVHRMRIVFIAMKDLDLDIV